MNYPLNLYIITAVQYLLHFIITISSIEQ